MLRSTGNAQAIQLPQVRRKTQEQTKVLSVCVCVCMHDSFLFFLIERSIQLRFLCAGISLRGPTGICIFEGTMNADLFTQILDQTLLPFLQDGFLDSHCFMQENNPKHTSVQQKIL